jgi:ABC-type Mn2+/Zn2+ transport system ATPase subunit
VNEDLKRLVHERLVAEGLLTKNWSSLVLSACDGPEALEERLQNKKASAPVSANPQSATPAGAFLTSVTVQGFRGIGPAQTLTLNPGPGLTVVVGRNGSGKSSFAEAAEVLFTGDSKRWSGRSKIWKEGWRCLHQPHPSSIEATLLLEGQGSATVTGSWDKDAPLEGQKVVVQPKGKPKTTLQALGWQSALKSYRPFLSYNELGSMLDEGPAKLYDALSVVLGLEDLVTAQDALAKSRLNRQKALDSADDERTVLIDRLTEFIQEGEDDRASACLKALSEKSWGLAEVERIVGGKVPPVDRDIGTLNQALSLSAGDPEDVEKAVADLRAADLALKKVAGTDAETARQIVLLLEKALEFHAGHGDGDCPVCGSDGKLTKAWAEATHKEIDKQKAIAAGSAGAHRVAEAARKQANALLSDPPLLLKKLFEIGITGLAEAQERWTSWSAGKSIADLVTLADHMESTHPSFLAAVENLKKEVEAELVRREDRWRPVADDIKSWLEIAKPARRGAEDLPRIKQAEEWLKGAAAVIRNQRFAPIADKAMSVWEHLRQQSNVSLGRIELTGAKTQRRVALDVTVDGVAGAALGVMSQGELHALALSLFLPRATLSESPFRFVVIDDPVQSMDPSRVDGLARALDEAAQTRQVVVFTHDERLPEAIRRLNVKATVLGVTRRPKSVVEVRTSLDPVRAHIEDALALVHTTDLPQDVLRALVPGFCRSAIEASFIHLIRRRRLAAGHLHSEVEEELKGATKLVPLAALALFDDKEKGGDVMKRLNQFGSWAGDVFKKSKDGVHDEVEGSLKFMIQDTEKLSGKIMEMK